MLNQIVQNIDLVKFIVKVVLCLFTVVYCINKVSNSINRYTDTLKEKNAIERDKVFRMLSIDSDKTEKELEDFISGILSEYALLHIVSQNLPYINDNIENEMRTFIVNEVADKMPQLLLWKLNNCCNHDYIAKLIANKVNMLVIDYRLSYNINQK